MELYNGVIKRIIGMISPYGDSSVDEVRSINLNTHIDITTNLVEDLIEVSRYKDRNEYSMKIMGELAYNELLELKQMIDNVVEE